jgi:hypothetical protein
MLVRKEIYMLKEHKFLPLLMILLSLACGVVSQPLPGTQVSIPTLPSPTTITTLPIATNTPASSPTSVPTQIPTTAPSATVDSLAATQMAIMGSMGTITTASLYFHPVGTPLSNWRSVPIMPQATAGQQFSAYIYSYTAAATLDQARLFYEGKAQLLGFTMAPGSGFSGTGSNAQHNVSFVSYNLTLYLASFDNDTSHVIVILSKYP